jgi:hypothetical protein
VSALAATTDQHFSWQQYVPTAQFVKDNPAWSQIRFNNLIARRHENGLEAHGALVKRAGRWYVVVPLFESWLARGIDS